MQSSHQISAIVLLADSSRGVYIPQNFVQTCYMAEWHVNEEDSRVLLAGPDHEHYWETWDSVLNNAYWEKDGKRWHLSQDGDLWAFCAELMTREEKRNWDMDVDPFEYVIDLDERGEFKASVYDDKSNVVFSIDGQEIFDDGFMKHKNDMDGLKAHLVDLGIMDKADKLID